MYDNIGGKIKGAAVGVFVLEVIASVIAGILVMVEEEEILIGILLILIVPLVAWVSSWLLYGFGELIEKTCQMERNARVAAKKTETQRATILKELTALKGLIQKKESSDGQKSIQQ